MTARSSSASCRSARYRDVDRVLLDRLAEEELPRSRNADDAVKRVKRRLHQAVGAFPARAPATRVRSGVDRRPRRSCLPRRLRRRAARPCLHRRASSPPRPFLRRHLGADRRRRARARPRLRPRPAGAAVDGPPPRRDLRRRRRRPTLTRAGREFLEPVGQPHLVRRGRRRGRAAARRGRRRAAAQAGADARPPGSAEAASRVLRRFGRATRS